MHLHACMNALFPPSILSYKILQACGHVAPPLIPLPSQDAMRQGGFKEVTTVEIDHRHRAVMGIRA